MTRKININIKSITILFSLLFCANIFSQKTTIYGTLPSYANDELVFYSFEDQISYKEKEVARTTVNDTGYFHFTVETDKVIKIFSYMEVFYVYMYIEPNYTYEIKFPPKTKKLPEDELNPYFQEFITPAAIVKFISDNNTPKDQETNLLIKIFNDSFLSYYRKYTLNMATNGNISQLNGDINKLIRMFPPTENEFFNDYTFYKYGQLKYLTNKDNHSGIIKEYFAGKPILYNNPAYIELFNELFNNYFSKVGATPNGRSIYDDIGNQKSYDKLSATLKKDKLLKDNSLRELIIIKGLYDGFYSPDFPRKSLLVVLDQAVENASEKHLIIAKNVQQKVTHLMTGYPSPDFTLYDKDSNLVKLSDFTDKYIYLNFCKSQSYTSVSDLELLKKLHEKHSDKLTIITISADDDFNELLNIAVEKDYNWLFLHYKRQKDLLKDFNVRVYPTYYLIGPGSELLLSPSSPPSENFEYQLFTIMRSKGDI